jgi:crotonobetainyl-CoA:carnitine CoA-transferase CaiB-like acyl-CoA transferase
VTTASSPLTGLTVVEVVAGTTELGLGLASGVPGMIFADLGAEVIRVVDPDPPPIDDGVTWGRVWHRNKRIVPEADPVRIQRLMQDADVALVYGTESLVEGRGLGYRDLAERNPALVHIRCRPSRTAQGTVADFGLLVEAQAGFCTQLAGHRSGPIMVDAHAPGAGTALLVTTSAMALLCRRADSGAGGWAETSLYDGMLATLGCMIGRSERAAPKIEEYWREGSFFPNFLYRCADGELIQVWFGGKGMYARLLDVLGDEPSTAGYYTDQVTGALRERAVRWRGLFEKQPRDHWIRSLRAAGVACEPVLGPGEALSDPHAAEVGLAITDDRDGHRDVVMASPITVTPIEGAMPTRSPGPTSQLLDGLRVLDFSAFVAGPLAAQVLADLGADVIKVEPPEGEAMRAAAYAMAACQRGKRSIALDITAEQARPVVTALLEWADVVLHNFRVGVSERLGIDEASTAALNPGVVYCHASGFGSRGSRATFPGNDALMQALTGFEDALGGAGNDPIGATWIPLDMTGGWVAAIGILAGLYARRTTGQGARVETSLLGAGMLLHSGVYLRDGAPVRGPALDADQTGYGPGYRLYRAAGDSWLALVLPDPSAWERLRSLPEFADLPAKFVPLHGGPDDDVARTAERILEMAFASASAAHWVARLRAERVPVEVVRQKSRDAFRSGILDDTVNRQLGRVVGYATADWGYFEQIGPLMRCSAAAGGPALALPAIGEHSVQVLRALGFDVDEISALLDAKVVRQI